MCDDGFNNAAARVVCQMLKYDDGQFIGNRHGAGSGTIWLDDVRCSGTETSITGCRHNGWGSHNCRHEDDVSVLCLNEVRLVGDSGSRGRLEVFYNGTWGTVCGNGFNDAAARVVNAPDGLLVTTTVAVTGVFGWTTCVATAQCRL